MECPPSSYCSFNVSPSLFTFYCSGDKKRRCGLEGVGDLLYTPKLLSNQEPIGGLRRIIGKGRPLETHLQ